MVSAVNEKDNPLIQQGRWDWLDVDRLGESIEITVAEACGGVACIELSADQAKQLIATLIDFLSEREIHSDDPEKP